MFQYAWFNKLNYEKKSEAAEKATDFLSLNDIKYMRMSYWVEHCLECAAPLCYNSCSNWIERFDGACQRFYYGIYNNKQFKQFPYHAELKFRKWGKLETNLFAGTVSPKVARQLDGLNRLYSAFLLPFFKIFKLFFLNSKLKSSLEYLPIGFTRRFRKQNNIVTDTFLFQAYSYDNTAFNLCLDIISDNKQIYREKIAISPGYNQTILDLSNKVDVALLVRTASSEALVRIYPENDYEAEIIVLFADFVKLKKELTKANPQVDKEPAAKVKCVAWDLDNTVWNGTLIESNPAELQLNEHVLDTILMLDAKGIIQTVVSKNYESEAVAVLKRLGIDNYFVYKAINWESKSSNIAYLAQLLNININTFALIDDSAFERNEVASQFSCVRTYEENILLKLSSLDEFDVPITEESKNRREMYQTEVRRIGLEKEYNGNNLRFLKECKIKARIAPPATEQIVLRCYELVHRTNQLNLSGKRYEKDAFFQHVSQNINNSFVVFCEDKFGNYGQIAFFVTDLQDDILYVVEFAMSCRVAGKYVESALIKWLQDKHLGAGIKYIVFKGINSGKNRLLIESLQEIGMENVSKESTELILKIDVSNLPRNWDIVTVIDHQDRFLN